MSSIGASASDAVLVGAADAERIGNASQLVRLLVDSSSAQGRLSAQRVTLREGTDGASPHHHSASSELFFVISGTAQLLAGEVVVECDEGDLAVVPPGTPHAFAAAAAQDADLLIVMAPGIERFEYFRHLARIAAHGRCRRPRSRKRSSATRKDV